MKKARTRVILAFIFLALVQIACGCSVDHDVAVHVYQDLNGNSTQDSDEPSFPGIEIGNDITSSFVKTNNSGDISVGTPDNTDCSNYWPPIHIPSGYTVTENKRNPANWDFTPIYGTAVCPSYFKFEQQSGTWTVGLQPLFTMTKTASPTTFSAAEQTITYTYVISNTTANDFTQVSVTDDKTTVTCPAATVSAGEFLTCTATYVTSGGDVSRGSITNTAQFTANVALRDNSGYGYNLNLTSAPVTATVTLEEVQTPVGERPAPPILLDPAPVFTSAVLTGDVYTLCDTVNRPVNLKLVAGTDNALVTQELAAGNLQIQIAGTDISSTCQVNPSNTTLLTCTYPAGLTSLPADGKVIYKTTILQTFRFDGETGCAAPPSGGSSSGDTNNQPETCDPNQSGTPCFCEQNPNDESCATQD